MKYVVIGGGIIGSTIARELVLRGYGNVTVLEKEGYLGEHASGRNTGVLHSGINQKPGSLKARMSLEGNKRAREYAERHGVRFERCGTLVVARNSEEEQTLERLLYMGQEVGVEGLEIIDETELKKREPKVTGYTALFSPNGAIVDSKGFLEAVADEAKEKGARFVMGAKVHDIKGNRVITSRGEFEADYIINCAGLYADRIAHIMGVGPDYEIIPFRGEYMEIRNAEVNSMVYQAPDLRYPFLGVHLTKTIDGKVIAGPTSMLAFGRESYEKEFNLRETMGMLGALNFWRLATSMEFLKLVWHNAKISFSKKAFLEEIQTLYPEAAMEDIVPYRSGIRAQMVDRSGKMLDDLVVDFSLKNAVHILNAVSPGMTSSLAFAEFIVSDERFLKP